MVNLLNKSFVSNYNTMEGIVPINKVYKGTRRLN